MTAVWYTGPGDRSITTAQWAAIGVAGATDSVWNAAVGWSLPASMFNASQLAYLASDTGFNVNGADGPRPGAVVAAGANPAPTPADGQIPVWSASLGQWVYQAPGAGGELAYAANVTGTQTSCTTTGGVGAAVDIPGLAISVPPSLRPVVIEWGCDFNESNSVPGSLYVQLVETTGGANTVIKAFVEPFPQQTGTLNAAQYIATVFAKFRLGAVATTRTFKVNVLCYTPAATTQTINVLNGAGTPSYIRAEAA